MLHTPFASVRKLAVVTFISIGLFLLYWEATPYYWPTAVSEDLQRRPQSVKDPSQSSKDAYEEYYAIELAQEGGQVPPANPNRYRATTNADMRALYNRIQALIRSWTPPPVFGKWPPYEWYAGRKDYDPNRWEGFDWDNDYYIKNGIHSLSSEPQTYAPFPDYNSPRWKEAWRGEYKQCGGPINAVKAFPSLPRGFPVPSIGDANATGIDLNRCFDREGRYGAYNESLDWGALQDECVARNAGRYANGSATNRVPVWHMPANAKSYIAEDYVQQTSAPRNHSRTALLIRTWEGYTYTDNDIRAIRSLVSELSLSSGAEYQVFLFVNVKERDADIYLNATIRQQILDEHVPKEFHAISLLWTERVLEHWYPKVTDWQVYWHQFMSLQWFSKTHPEYDFIWNWETDARYTGHHYNFLEGVADYARRLPRKYLWERSSRFYFPSAHGSFDDFLESTDSAIEYGWRKGKLKPVWGPRPYNRTIQKPIGPKPPLDIELDTFRWGVGEEADLITLQPMWDPRKTGWDYKRKIWNYIPGVHPVFRGDTDVNFDHPAHVKINRRVYINTVSRFSKRQLHAMHIENMAGRSMQAEQFPATVALHHGLKAVYAPHPIWMDRKWPSWYLDAIFNNDEGEPANWSQGPTSVYNRDREHNFAGWSWYFDAQFPRVLYRRWLGRRASVGEAKQYPTNALRDVGGREFENEGVEMPDGSVVGGKGRMCLPGMLLHPVKGDATKE